MKPRNIGPVCAVALLLLFVAVTPGLRADWMDAAMREHYTLELDRAKAALAATTQEQEGLKGSLAPRLAAVDELRAKVKAEVSAARERLVPVLAEGNADALATAQAEAAACQAELEAVETEKSLIQRRLDEASREVDAWRERVADLELGLRLDARASLAAPADIANRDKKIESSRKGIVNQGAQVRKYAKRRRQAEREWADIQEQIAAAVRCRRAGLGKAAAADLSQRYQAAVDRQITHLRRSAERQQERAAFSKVLEDRAWRNVRFFRTQLEILQAFAAATKERVALEALEEAQLAADNAEKAVDAGRQAVEVRLKVVGEEIVAATEAVEKAQAAVAQAGAGADRAAAVENQAAAAEKRARWEAQRDFLKEYLALQKAMAAAVREKADKAKTAVELKAVDAILDQMPELRESATTSEEYVAGFKSRLDTVDGLIESGRASLGLDADKANRLFEAIGQAVATFAKKESAVPQRVEEYLQRLAGKLAGTVPDASRQALAMQVLLRVSQRALLRERLTLSEQWLADTRAFLQQLEQRAAQKLWERQDPRLQRDSLAELANLAGNVRSDLEFLGQAYRMRLAADAGFAGVVGCVLLTIGMVVLGALSALLTRRLAGRCPDAVGRWWLKRVVPLALVLLFFGTFCLSRFGENRFAILAGYAAVCVAAWWALRCLLQAGCCDRRFPSGKTLTGAVLANGRMLLGTAAVLVPLALLCRESDLWALGGVLLRVWWFFVWLAAFRLALHPALLGRFLSRNSENRGLRLLGGVLAWACVLAAIVAVVPYLLSLESLGTMVLRISETTLVIVCIAIALCGVTGWALGRVAGRQSEAGVSLLLVRRIVQVAIGAVACRVVGGLWQSLLRDLFLSPDAPVLVQKTGALGLRFWGGLVGAWHHGLVGGMTVESLFKGIVVLVLSCWGAKLVQRVFMERVLARTPMDESTRQTFGAVLGYLIIVTGFLVGLNVAGSSLKNLALLAGAVTVGLGFGLQNVINNFVSSLMIHFGQSIQVGDYIEVGGQRGTVQEIGLRSTRIFTDDGITVLVPNGSFVTANIINWTNPSRSVRLHVPVSILRTVDKDVAIQAVTEVALAHPEVQKKPVPIVETRAVTADRISLELLAWTKKPQRLATIVGELTLAVDKVLREKGYC
ncbi:MAG: hypothetical protein A3K19_03465 [Lentisphaerae bacterium RIFOXYB12_FULL_65_16]|nr:MAG: hypothetical protein A3K18_01245 [Lentisphaerae bacterium RIFOXYA12_64_32]OGV86626.1 MAG: hypothetical protein A3K19_03465 [Lentisphaerae bacterium RIFOXYB12_FULL_65_16]